MPQQRPGSATETRYSACGTTGAGGGTRQGGPDSPGWQGSDLRQQPTHSGRLPKQIIIWFILNIKLLVLSTISSNW